MGMRPRLTRNPMPRSTKPAEGRSIALIVKVLIALVLRLVKLGFVRAARCRGFPLVGRGAPLASPHSRPWLAGVAAGRRSSRLLRRCLRLLVRRGCSSSKRLERSSFSSPGWLRASKRRRGPACSALPGGWPRRHQPLAAARNAPPPRLGTAGFRARARLLLVAVAAMGLARGRPVTTPTGIPREVGGGTTAMTHTARGNTGAPRLQAVAVDMHGREMAV